MRIFEANFTGGQVYIHNGTVPVPDAKVLGDGKADSSGVLLLAGADCVYVPQTTPDMTKALKILSDGFTTLSNSVVQASGGASDVGGATPQFKANMTAVANKLNQLAGELV